jgi:predicted metal-binding protein
MKTRAKSSAKTRAKTRVSSDGGVGKKASKTASRTSKSDLSEFVGLALESGARNAKVIDAATVKCEAWVRLKCQFGCGGYAKRLTCPPMTPTPDETAAVVACYKRAILIHCHDNDIVNDIIPRLEREVFLAGYYKALGFGSGPCHLCDICNVKGRCVHPYSARPSMEACGINVYATAHANGFPLHVVRSRREEGDYYGLVLVD